MPALRLTIDTNCVIHSVAAQGYASEVDELVELARSGYVELSLATAFEVDQEKASEVRRTANLDWLFQRPVIARVPQPLRLDFSPLGDSGFVLGAEDTSRVSDEIERILLPPQYRTGSLNAADHEFMRKWRRKVIDVQHLLAHNMSGNYAFVTSDEDDMVKRRDALRASTGIAIWTLPEAVQAARMQAR